MSIKEGGPILRLAEAPPITSPRRDLSALRLYVADRTRGLGLGRALLEGLEAAARGDGFRAMLLDTGDRMTEAQAMYRAAGFETAAPYPAYPARLAALVFMGESL